MCIYHICITNRLRNYSNSQIFFYNNPNAKNIIILRELKAPGPGSLKYKVF